MAITRVKDGRVVLTGQLSTGTYSGLENRISLFDGKYTTGYRVVDFRIAPKVPSATYEVTAKLSTEPKSAISQFNWQDVQEIAWAGWNFTNSSSDLEYLNIREENMVIEDLWISLYYSAEAIDVNYEIILEKYNFTDWDGAAVIINNLSQAGPN